MMLVVARQVRSWLLFGCLTGLTTFGLPDARGQAPTSASVAQLQDRVQALEDALRQVQAQKAVTTALPVSAEGGPSSVPPATFAGPPGATAQSPDQVSSLPGFGSAGWQEGFFLQNADRTFVLRITGQLQADYRAFLDKNDTTDIDTFLVRRARLGIEATILKYYEFRLLPDFAGTVPTTSITDA